MPGFIRHIIWLYDENGGYTAEQLLSLVCSDGESESDAKSVGPLQVSFDTQMFVLTNMAFLLKVANSEYFSRMTPHVNALTNPDYSSVQVKNKLDSLKALWDLHLLDISLFATHTAAFDNSYHCTGSLANCHRFVF